MEILDQSLADFPGHEPLTLTIRLGLALVLGGILGIDREVRQKPAGLRSHMLVSLSAACFTIITFNIVEAASEFDDPVQIDPVRLMEAVIAGVAFLGAGAIIQGGGTVKGVTTGASMWLAGALGVCCGLGYYMLASITAGLGFFVLLVIGWLEIVLGPKEGQKQDLD